MNKLTLRQVLEIEPFIGRGNKTRLADALGITKQAVSAQPMDGPIPDVWHFKLKHEVAPSAYKAALSQHFAPSPCTTDSAA